MAKFYALQLCEVILVQALKQRFEKADQAKERGIGKVRNGKVSSVEQRLQIS